MSSIYDWSQTAADNANSDSAINWAEGMAPSGVNNSAREVMGRVAEYLADNGGALAAGGTANVITVTANSAFTAYADGLILALRITADNTGATTLNANGLGAKSVRKMLASGESALTGAELQADGIYLFRYSTALNTAAGGWLLLNPTIDVTPYATIASPTFTGTPAAPTATAGTNTTQIATTAFATGAISTAIAALSSVYQAASAVLTALAGVGTAVAGDIIYASGAGAWGRLAKGTAAQQLRMNAGATAPEWFTAPTGGVAKAWVNFNGTGTVAIRSSFNVASITDNGTGDYTINFTTAMADANYAVMICPSQPAVTTVTGQVTSQATGSCRFTVTREGTGLTDLAVVSVVIFGN